MNALCNDSMMNYRVSFIKKAGIFFVLLFQKKYIFALPILKPKCPGGGIGRRVGLKHQ